jgi:hypothetical protein
LKIKYSPSARDKLRQIKLVSGTKITGTIVEGINGLLNNPRRCPKIENMLGIPSPYYFFHIQHHYVFYRINDEVIYITDIYSERENFMWKMFGISLRSQESIDFWDE